MSEKAAKQEYNILLNCGELLEMFPNFSGNWSRDKKEFLKFHELNEEILNLEVNYEELEEGFSGYNEDEF